MRAWGYLLALGVAFGLGAYLQRAPRRPTTVAQATSAAQLQAKARVILITLDGPVRRDVLQGPHLEGLHEAVEREGVLFPAVTASVLAFSLVGYQAMYVGALTACRDNDCPRVRVETVAEALARRLGLAPREVAVFASWGLLRRAVSASDGALFIDAPPTGARAEDDRQPPWGDARFDDETFARARAYWQAHQPRFFHLALLDTDEWAHLGRRAEYERALRETDARIVEVLQWVQALPPEEAALTTVIVTADHGRGRADWRQHGFFRRGSRDIFIAALGPLVAGGTQRRADQTDLRPTIERLFGLCPERRAGEGVALNAVVGELPCTKAPSPRASGTPTM